jgi:tetratricopeptide (TPR) repeat protein
MATRRLWILVSGIFVLGLLARVSAAEPAPWEGEHDPFRMRMEQLAEQEARGALDVEQAREVNRYWSTHLRRGPMTSLEAARSAIAEIHLRRGEPKEAIAALGKVLEAAASEDLKGLTHFNLAEIYRRQLDDAAKALEHYQKVEGALRPRAQLVLLALLADMGQADEAARKIEELIQAAKDRGEKLALLQRLAGLYDKAKMLDKALAIYQRILKDFTPADIETMRQAAAAEARETVQKMDAARRNGDGQEVERLERQLRGRVEGLRIAGRWEEFRAFEQAARALMQQLFRPGPPPQGEQPPEPGRKREGEF